MHVLSLSTPGAFGTAHPKAETASSEWHGISRPGPGGTTPPLFWRRFQRPTWSAITASSDIRGSELRLIVPFEDRSRIAIVCSVGTHSQEALNRRRPLTLDTIRTVREAWKIPRDALTDAAELVPGAPKRGARRSRPVPDAA